MHDGGGEFGVSGHVGAPLYLTNSATAVGPSSPRALHLLTNHMV